MRKLFVEIPVLIFLLTFSVASAQKNQQPAFVVPAMTINEETKLVTYSGVIEENAVKDELYKRALKFFNTNYKNPVDVIKKQDEAIGEIEGIARFTIYNPSDKDGVRPQAGLVSYTINLKMKDNRYKYEITKINWKQASYYGIEKWMDKSSPNYKAIYDYYLVQTDEQMKELTEKLAKAMKQPSVQQKNDEW